MSVWYYNTFLPPKSKIADKFESNAIFVSETEFGRLAWDMNATVNINMPLDECIGLKRR